MIEVDFNKEEVLIIKYANWFNVESIGGSLICNLVKIIETPDILAVNPKMFKNLDKQWEKIIIDSAFKEYNWFFPKEKEEGKLFYDKAKIV